MERAALLELLYLAHDRSQTVRATVRRWSDDARLRELLRARSQYRAPTSIPPEEGSWGAPPSRIEATTRIWAARPYWLRWETDVVVDDEPAGQQVGVKESELLWERWADGQVHSNEHRESGGTMTTVEERLLDPAPLLGAFRFEIGDESTWLGRSAIRATRHASRVSCRTTSAR